MTTGGGTLPLRKPGMRRSRPSLRAACVEAPLDLLGRDLGLDADARFGQLGDGGLDGHRARNDSLGPCPSTAGSPPGCSRARRPSGRGNRRLARARPPLGVGAPARPRSVGEPVTVEDLLASARERLERVEPTGAEEALRDGRAVLRRHSLGFPAGRRRGRARRRVRGAQRARMAAGPGFRVARSGARTDRRLIVMCDQGYQSSLVAATLQELGHADATDLVGGFQAWRGGRPTRAAGYYRCTRWGARGSTARSAAEPRRAE